MTDMEHNFYQTLSADVAIVGGGLAALTCGRRCAEAGLSVVMIVKRELCSGSSFYPLTSGLGCQTTGDGDDRVWFLEELKGSGAGMEDEGLSRIYIDESRKRIEDLEALGIPYFVRTDSKKACFAKRARHCLRLIELQRSRRTIAEKFYRAPNVTVLEYCDALTLIKEGARAAGVAAADERSKLYYIKATSVVLASGGYGGLYKHSLNSVDVIGSGHAMALKAGAALVNLEFIQFIPGVISPTYKLLFSETSLRYGEGLFNKAGEDILQKYLPEGISEQECLALRSGHGPFTNKDSSRYFDIAMMGEILKTGEECGFRVQYSPDMFRTDDFHIRDYLALCRNNQVDLEKDSLWIAPFCHAANGGVWINEHAQTTVEGLYAAGEVSGGLHGADRHGGNSTGSCLVFGHRAAESIIGNRQKRVTGCSEKEAMEQCAAEIHGEGSGCVLPEEVMTKVRNILWKKCSVVRDGDHLEDGLNNVCQLRNTYNAAMLIKAGETIGKAMAASHALITAEAVLRAAAGRKESRGSHYRQDFPERDDEHFLKRQVVSMKKNRICSELI